MRKGSILCTVMLVLLAACGGEGAGSEQEMLDARSKYLSMAGCTAQVELTADYGERIFPCTVVLDHTAGGETTLTLLEPELLRGVTARVRAGELTLEFDGMAVEAGPLLPEGLSPLDCLPFVLEQMKTGYLSGKFTEGKTLTTIVVKCSPVPIGFDSFFESCKIMFHILSIRCFRRKCKKNGCPKDVIIYICGKTADNKVT